MKSKEQIKKRLEEVKRLIAEIDGGKLIIDYPIGSNINIKFRDVSISIKKIGYNIFEVISKGDSIKIKEGDLLRIKDENTVLSVGEKISFEIFRKAMDYQTDAIDSIS